MVGTDGGGLATVARVAFRTLQFALPLAIDFY